MLKILKTLFFRKYNNIQTIKPKTLILVIYKKLFNSMNFKNLCKIKSLDQINLIKNKQKSLATQVTI